MALWLILRACSLIGLLLPSLVFLYPKRGSMYPTVKVLEPLFTGVPRSEVLDVCCVDWSRDRKGAIIVSPHQGAKDGPAQPYPTPPPDGRGPERPVLPRGRRLRPSQSPSWALPIPKAARRLGSHRPRPLPATAGNREPTLVLARRREVLFSPVPRCGGLHPSSFHRRVRRLRRFLEPLRRGILSEMGGGPETLLVDSTLLSVL